MTCKEKLIKDHPEYTDQVIEYILEHDCPNEHYLFVREPEYCDAYTEACTKCWDREFPEKAAAKATIATGTNPCVGCERGWGSISTDGCKSCHDDCEDLKRYMDSTQISTETCIERTYTGPKTASKETRCETCAHEPVCIYRAQFSEILRATQQSNGICAHPGIGREIDLNSTEYVKIDIFCKYYHRKAEVTRNGI